MKHLINIIIVCALPFISNAQTFFISGIIFNANEKIEIVVNNETTSQTNEFYNLTLTGESMYKIEFKTNDATKKIWIFANNAMTEIINLDIDFDNDFNAILNIPKPNSKKYRVIIYDDETEREQTYRIERNAYKQ